MAQLPHRLPLTDITWRLPVMRHAADGSVWDLTSHVMKSHQQRSEHYVTQLTSTTWNVTTHMMSWLQKK